MQNGFPYLDILIFGVIAIFLIFRLKNILGTKTGFEENSLKKDNQTEQYSNVISLKSNNDKTINSAIDKIIKVDPNFNEVDFLNGSKTFFEMVHTSFVSGNLDNIKKFIKPTVFKSFKSAIDDRNKENETLIIDLKSFKKQEILTSEITKRSIKINVVFETLQIKALIDQSEKIIDGDMNKEILVKNEWIFERKINQSNPNWTLIETKSM